MSPRSRAPLRVGTFIPPAGPARGPLDVGKVPEADHRTLMDLLAAVDGVDFVHGLDIREAHVRDGQVHYRGIRLAELDLYICFAELDRGADSYHLDVLKALSRDVRVIPDPHRFEAVLDKFTAHTTLRRAGISVPDTILVDHRTLTAAEPLLAEWGRAVLKPRRGYLGHGVLLVEDFPTLRDLADYLGNGETFLLERFLRNDISTQVGVTVLNGQIMYGYRKRPVRHVAMGAGAMKIYDPDGLGGAVDLAAVPVAHAELALRAQRALNLDIIGFDIITHDGQPVIVDENTFPGFYPELFAQAGRDLAAELYRLITQEIHRCRVPNTVPFDRTGS